MANTTSSGLPTPSPVMDPAISRYWDAANEGRLELPTCADCGLVIWYPRPFCPDCASRNLEWIESPGTGSIYSFTITRRGQGAYREAAPYVLAYVELDEGPRVLTNIASSDIESIAIGDRVEAIFDPVENSRTRADEGSDPAALLRFRTV